MKIERPSFVVGHTVAQLVEALRYKPKGRGFDYNLNHETMR